MSYILHVVLDREAYGMNTIHAWGYIHPSM